MQQEINGVTKGNYVVKGAKPLQRGFTTGSCASASAAAATQMLVTQSECKLVKITLANGESAVFTIEDIELTRDYAICSVTKDAGDDPDVTHGAKIYAKVSFNSNSINIFGGVGVGIVTQQGLPCKVGEHAINPVPRRVIRENCQRILAEHNITTGLNIEISVPTGVALAEETFNPRLGIVGGISILGTTGIVEPMSEAALVDTIKIMIDKEYTENPHTILISPGNYGQDFCEDKLNLDINRCVKVSNYIGEALDYIRYKGFKKVLLVGHIGKLIKLSGGVMNTHSAVADCRMELLALFSLLSGATNENAQTIMNAVTTQQALKEILQKEFYPSVEKLVIEKALYYCNFRLKEKVEIGIIMFETETDTVIESHNAREILAQLEFSKK